jgi:hypothetical protein
MFFAWKHLANAGLISGQYTGIVAPGGHPGLNHDAGVNYPTGFDSSACYGFWGFSAPVTPTSGATGHWPGNYGGIFMKFEKAGNADPIEQVFTPEEA